MVATRQSKIHSDPSLNNGEFSNTQQATSTNSQDLAKKSKKAKVKSKNEKVNEVSDDNVNYVNGTSIDDDEAPAISKKKKVNKVSEDNDNKIGAANTKNVQTKKRKLNEDDDKIKKKTVQEKKIKKSTKNKAVKLSDIPVPRPNTYTSLGSGPAPVPQTGKIYMGCHVSGAGGVWNAFEDATSCKAKSFALFLRSQRKWEAKPLDDDTITKWKEIMGVNGIAPHLILPHGSYLMNLGSPDSETLGKSRKLFVEELNRCQKLGIPHFNFHPGSSVGKISREECCKLIAESINLACDQTKDVICVLENMSKQGNTIGGDLHEIRLIIENVKDKSRVGVCIDTCHAHAAGYDLGTEEGFNELLKDFETIIGWQFLRGIHINDSKGKFGDHLDRHENIGKGTIGKQGFERIMNCVHFKDLPLILETPFTDNNGYAKEISMLEKMVQ